MKFKIFLGYTLGSSIAQLSPCLDSKACETRVPRIVTDSVVAFIIQTNSHQQWAVEKPVSILSRFLLRLVQTLSFLE